MKMLGDQVLVRRLPEETMTKGGIIIPEAYTEKPMSGEVVSVGPGRANKWGVRIPIDLTEGDTVLFRKYAGIDIKIKEEDFLILTSNDVLGVIEGAGA